MLIQNGTKHLDVNKSSEIIKLNDKLLNRNSIVRNKNYKYFT